MLYLSLGVCGQEEAGPPVLSANPPGAGFAFSSAGGSLWVEGGRGSGFWGAALSLNRSPWYGAVGAGGLLSNLPAFDTEYTGAWFNAGLGTAPLGLDLSGGLFHRDVLNAEVFGVPVSGGGADGYFLRLGLPLRFGNWRIGPSFLFAQGFWKEGDLYWFFGKPQVPVLFITGLSAAFREEQRLYFHYLSLNPRILSPFLVDEKLFTGHIDGFTATYRWTLNRKSFSLDTFTGWLSVSGSMKGSLNAENQPYLLFPYAFYHAAFEARFHGLFGALTAEYRRGFFRLNMTLGAAQVLLGGLNLDIHSKQKKLSYLGVGIFDGQEEFDSWSLNPEGLGGAFLQIKGGLEALPLGRNRHGPRLSVSAGKLFALPWGYEPVLSSGLSDPGGGDKDGPGTAGDGLNIAGILLSGLSFSCTITW